MKKILLILSVLASALTTQAQDSLYVYRTGGAIESKAISAIDSITFSSAQDSMYIHHSGTTVASYAKAYIDSISFTRVAIAQSTTTDSGVVINGVRWASRNVNTPGTFASNSTDYGYFYQWNSNVGWPSTGAIDSITASDGAKIWNSSWTGGYTSPSSTDKWTSTNDPSPKGWRVPTYAEIQSLLNTAKVTATWTTENGVNGRTFTDKTTGNTFFLPASGSRGYDGLLGSIATAGYDALYWSNTSTNSANACTLGFDCKSSYCRSSLNRAGGFSVRPVAK